MSEVKTLEGEDLGDCPFCGRRLAVGFTGGEPDSLIHALPMCERFEKMTPDEFIVAAREAMEVKLS